LAPEKDSFIYLGSFFLPSNNFFLEDPPVTVSVPGFYGPYFPFPPPPTSVFFFFTIIPLVSVFDLTLKKALLLFLLLRNFFFCASPIFFHFRCDGTLVHSPPTQFHLGIGSFFRCRPKQRRYPPSTLFKNHPPLPFRPTICLFLPFLFFFLLLLFFCFFFDPIRKGMFSRYSL